jgi:hypothetical protein
MKPSVDTIPTFYQNYFLLVKEEQVLDALKNSSNELMVLVQNISEKQSKFSYAEGKWTIKELLVHMMDAERIFAYRALRFSRNDRSSLPGFDEQAYAPESNAGSISLSDLLSHIKNLRQSTIDLFNTFNNDMLLRSGFANNYEMSVIALGFIIAGHERHHINIIKERYLAHQKCNKQY